MVKFQYAPRESNTVIDWLARDYPCTDVNLGIIEFLDFHVKRLLLDDKFGNILVISGWFKVFGCLFLIIKKNQIKIYILNLKLNHSRGTKITI